MKCVELKQVFEYKDSDKWLSEEIYGGINYIYFISETIYKGNYIYY